jgi:cytochrome c oxidase assembly factor CtaG
MHPLIGGLLSPWEFRPEVLFPVLLMGTLYVLGWLRIRRKLDSRAAKPSGKHKLASGWRLAAYLGGLASLLLALLSPIDVLGGQLLIMHMVQHKILVMVAAPLLWLGDPFPIVLWALPANLRRAVGSLFERDTLFRRALTAATQPGICWLVLVFVYIGWHDPGLYDAALRIPWVHNLEHITFFGAAMLFWYPVVNSAPHLHKALPYWVRIVYLIAFVPPNAIAGASIAMATDIIYPHYATVPHIWGFTALEDQAWGGAIMWIWSSEMMIQTAVIMLGVSFYQEKRRKLQRDRLKAAHQQRRQQPAGAL